MQFKASTNVQEGRRGRDRTVVGYISIYAQLTVLQTSLMRGVPDTTLVCQ